jgi:hypothetical protein
MGTTNSLPSGTLEALEVCTGAVAAASVMSIEACDDHLRTVQSALRQHQLRKLGLAGHTHFADMAHSANKATSYLVVCDFSSFCQLSSDEIKVLTPPSRTAHRRNVRACAAVVAQVTEQLHGKVTLLPLLDDFSFLNDVVKDVELAVGKACMLPPSFLMVNDITQFGEVRADSMAVLWLPPVSLRAPLQGGIGPFIAPHVDVVVLDAIGAMFERHEIFDRLPSSVGLCALGHAASVDVDALAQVVSPTIAGARILIAGWVENLVNPAKPTPALEHIGRAEARLDHLCCLFDIVILVGHAPLAESAYRDFLATAEKRGVQVIRAADCAVASETGQVTDLSVNPNGPWPKSSAVLGFGSSTVKGIASLFAREALTTGGLNVTVLGDVSIVCPCEGLRDIALACGSACGKLRPGRFTVVSESDFMSLRLQSTATTSDTNDNSTLRKIPVDFGATLSRVTVPPHRVATWLCGAPPALLLRLPESAGLKAEGKV